MRLTIEDPFSLARAELVQGEPQALVVYPRLVLLDRLFSEGGAHAQEGRRLLLQRPTGFDLHSVRDYVHVMDLAAGHGLLAHVMLLLDDSSPSALAAKKPYTPRARISFLAMISSSSVPRGTIDDRPLAFRAINQAMVKSTSIGFNTFPSGHVAGIYARTDNTRGVFKAPAGTEANVGGTEAPRTST